MTTVGVLGIGRMGLAVATTLRDAGLAVRVFDVDPARLDAARSVGLELASDSLALARAVDVLVTVLPDAATTEAASPSILALAPGTLWVDLASGDPRITERLVAECAARGIRVVTATMGGGPDDAADARLELFVGATAADRAAASPLLAALTRDGHIIEVGEHPHDAQVVKLLANLLWFGQVIAATEALLLGVRLGLDLGALKGALRQSSGGSAFLDRHVDRLLAGDYLEDFALDRCVAELRVVTELARDARTPGELTSLVARIHEEALDRFGPVLGELLGARLLEERAGIVLGEPRVAES